MSNSETRRAYSTDLTDEQWAIIEPVLSQNTNPTQQGRRRDVSLREVVNAIRYIDRTGCQWDLLPHDLPPKSTVYDYFAKWRDNGKWNEVLILLRTRIRLQEGREETPSAACIDTQSVKTTEMGGEERGYDGGKKIKGRKRHLLVDTLGLLIAVVVTGANADDGTAAPRLLERVDEGRNRCSSLVAEFVRIPNCRAHETAGILTNSATSHITFEPMRGRPVAPVDESDLPRLTVILGDNKSLSRQPQLAPGGAECE